MVHNNIKDHIQTLDIIVVLIFFISVFSIAAYYSKKAGKGADEFYLSGRNIPRYIAGTTMVVADTPLALTELVAKNGIAGNWLWRNLVIGGMLTVFFFAKLWRRADIMTDVEFVELRHSGRAASVIRCFRAIYEGLFRYWILGIVVVCSFLFGIGQIIFREYLIGSTN